MSSRLPPDIELPAGNLSHRRIGSIVTVEVQGVEYRARIVDLHHERATLHLFQELSRPSEANLAITLIQALPKKEKMELIIQKSTELGVTAILPCTSAKSISLSEKIKDQDKTHRWSAIAAKAVEQSRRRLVPRIEECTDLTAALNGASGVELKLMLYEKELALDLHALADRDIASVAIAAGPEGGFTEDEVALAREYGYVPVRLGGRILRCETASIAALSIVQFLWGDL